MNRLCPDFCRASRHGWLILLLLAAVCTALAAKEESAEAIAERAAAAPERARPSLYTDAAEIRLKAADSLYTEGKADEARTAVKDVINYSEKAQEAAVHTGSKLKNTEIELRKMAAKLRDIRRTLAFDDQAPVQEAADRLEQLRTELLSRMFGKGKK